MWGGQEGFFWWPQRFGQHTNDKTFRLPGPRPMMRCLPFFFFGSMDQILVRIRLVNRWEGSLWHTWLKQDHFPFASTIGGEEFLHSVELRCVKELSTWRSLACLDQGGPALANVKEEQSCSALGPCSVQCSKGSQQPAGCQAFGKPCLYLYDVSCAAGRHELPNMASWSWRAKLGVWTGGFPPLFWAIYGFTH